MTHAPRGWRGQRAVGPRTRDSSSPRRAATDQHVEATLVAAAVAAAPGETIPPAFCTIPAGGLGMVLEDLRAVARRVRDRLRPVSCCQPSPPRNPDACSSQARRLAPRLRCREKTSTSWSPATRAEQVEQATSKTPSARPRRPVLRDKCVPRESGTVGIRELQAARDDCAGPGGRGRCAGPTECAGWLVRTDREADERDDHRSDDEDRQD